MNSEKRPICPDCGHEIDPDVCWCGKDIEDHGYYDEHSPVPMGCACGYNKKEFKMKKPKPPDIDHEFLDKLEEFLENHGWTINTIEPRKTYINDVGPAYPKEMFSANVRQVEWDLEIRLKGYVRP